VQTSDPAGLRIALMGTRGVPARYGGFETAVEEVGRRLADQGHHVTVYCRSDLETSASTWLGMRRRTLPAVRRQSLETLSHTGLSVLDAVVRPNYDVVVLFNAANAVFLPLLRLRRFPVAVHVDGLEWLRSKWSGLGRWYYRFAESLAVRGADALIADAAGIRDYYRDEFGASTELIRYGAPVQTDPGHDRLEELGVQPGAYHLVVARLEPENHVHVIVDGYRSSDAELPLLVVGSAPYSHGYTGMVRAAAAADDRIRMLGAVWDQTLLDQLYANAALYLHGHSVGGTNPSLLRAMGAGVPVAAYDVGFNREVLGPDGRCFADAAGVAAAVGEIELLGDERRSVGERLRERAAALYRWDEVAEQYGDLATALVAGRSRRGEVSGRRVGRRNGVDWSSGSPVAVSR
jgi:glycosyltransferase involved in cell wall biosynthesis